MRTLTLRKDTLVELTPAELVAVAGAGITSPCVTRPVTGIWCISVVCAE